MTEEKVKEAMLAAAGRHLEPGFAHEFTTQAGDWPAVVLTLTAPDGRAGVILVALAEIASSEPGGEHPYYQKPGFMERLIDLRARMAKDALDRKAA